MRPLNIPTYLRMLVCHSYSNVLKNIGIRNALIAACEEMKFLTKNTYCGIILKIGNV